MPEGRARVLLDATPIPADRGGVGRYVDGVVPALVQAGTELVVVCRRGDAPAFRAAGARVVIAPAVVERVAGRMIWEQFGLPSIARRVGASVIHSVHYTFPVLTRRARVVTVHDLTFFSDPSVHLKAKRIFFRAWIRALRFTRAVAITPSQATAGELAERVGFPASRIVVAHLAYNRDEFHEPDAAEVSEFARHHNLSRGWIAFLGTLEPRKNVVALVEAYSQLLEDRGSGRTPPLLLAGGRGWDEAVEPAINRARDAGADVRRIGYVPLEVLPGLLGGATIVAYPTLGEGFGLPVLEAMACGACVMTTRVLSIPEVGGDAVAYTGTDPESIATTLGRLLDDDPLRDHLRAMALRRAATFTWHATANAHIAAYEIAERG